MPVAAAILPLPFAVLLSVTATQSGQAPGEIDPGPLVTIGVIMIGIMLYLNFGAISGLIAAAFIRNARFGMSAVIGMGTTVGGGLVFAGFFGLMMLISLLAERIGLRISVSEPIEVAFVVVFYAILLAIIIATFVVMVILIRRIGRNAPE